VARARGGTWLLLWCGLALSARAADPPDATLRFDLRNADLPSVIEALAGASGTRVLYDPDLRARVTLALQTPVRPDEAAELLHAVLLATGFAMLPGPDGVQRILPLNDARALAPWQRAVADESDRVVVTLVRLEAADANEVARALDPRSQFGTLLFPWVPTNSLIVASSESRVRRALALVRALDRAEATELSVVPLRWAPAARAAEQLDAAFPTDTVPAIPQKIVVDERTNSLVLEAPPERLRALEDFLRTLDFPAPGRGVVHVVHVRNADAEELAGKLVALAGDDRSVLPAGSFQVVADPATNSLVVAAQPDAFAALAETIADLDRVPRRAVIDVTVLEIDHSAELALGFDALFPILVPDEVGDPIALGKIGEVLQFARPPPTDLPFIARIARNPIAIPFVGPGGIPISVLVPTTAAQITAGLDLARVTTLQQPHLLATTGEEQRIFVGQEVPVPATTTDVAAQQPQQPQPGQSPTTDPFVTELSIERRDVGVDLRVLPVALSDRVVELELEIHLTSLAGTASALAGPQLGPTLNESEVQAKVRLWDGAVALIAATPREDLVKTESGVPFLRRIPILGWAFKSIRDQRVVRRLVIAVQATSVDSPTMQSAESVRRRLAFERQRERTLPLESRTDAPYALLVASFTTRAEAEAALGELAGLPGTREIVEWQERDAPRFDLYLAGFEQIAEAGPPAFALREKGFRPSLTVLPDRAR
jgi:general secretion pathway protein D